MRNKKLHYTHSLRIAEDKRHLVGVISIWTAEDPGKAKVSQFEFPYQTRRQGLVGTASELVEHPIKRYSGHVDSGHAHDPWVHAGTRA